MTQKAFYPLLLLLGLVAVAQAQQPKRKTIRVEEGSLFEPVRLKPEQERMFTEFNFAHRALRQSSAASADGPRPQRQLKEGNATSDIDDIELGQAENSFGVFGGEKNNLWYHPEINSLSFVHRAAPGQVTGSNGGWLVYDLSTDGGENWELNQGPVYKNPNPQNLPPQEAKFQSGIRYPHGSIYNPPGNDDPEDAYMVYYGPVLDASNTSDLQNNTGWGGRGTGSHQLSGDENPNQLVVPTDSSFQRIIAEGYFKTSDGKVFILDDNVPVNDTLSGGDGGDDDSLGFYSNELILDEGTWDPQGDTMAYTTRHVDVPVTERPDGFRALTNPKIAFGPDGQVGYISALGHNNYEMEPDSVFYPILYRTTDGGETWEGPVNVVLNDNLKDKIALAFNQQFVDENNTTTTLKGDTVIVEEQGTVDTSEAVFSFAFEHDIAVDANGNIHIIGGITVSGWGPDSSEFHPSWSIRFASFGLNLFHIRSTGADSVWNDSTHFDITHLHQTDSWRGTFSGSDNQSITESLREQISRSPDGKRLFFAWFETHESTLGEDDFQNTNPDLFQVGYKVNEKMYTAYPDPTGGANDSLLAKYVTHFSPSWQLCSFGNVSPIAKPLGGGTYEIPVVFQEPPSDILAEAQYRYIKGNTVEPEDYRVPERLVANKLEQTGGPTPPYLDNVPPIVGLDDKVESEKAQVHLNAYPNPTGNRLTIEARMPENGRATFSLVNSMGQQVRSGEVSFLRKGQNTLRYDLSGLPQGVYFYTLTGENFSKSVRLMKD